jgi:urea carboxylase
MAWRAPAATNSSGAPSRSGIPTVKHQNSRTRSPGCCDFSIRFFPVSHAELTDWRRDFPFGRRSLQIDSDLFRLADYRKFLADHHTSIEAFQSRRRAAFEAEREEWARRNELTREEVSLDATLTPESIEVPHGAEVVESPLGGNVWRIHVRPGDRVEKGAVIAAIEAMKTECSVPSPAAGIVRAVYIQERQSISPGTPIIALEPTARLHATAV